MMLCHLCRTPHHVYVVLCVIMVNYFAVVGIVPQLLNLVGVQQQQHQLDDNELSLHQANIATRLVPVVRIRCRLVVCSES